MKKRFHRLKTVFFCLLTVLCVGLIFLSSLSWPDLSVEKITDIGQTLVIYDRNGEISASLNAGENRQCVPLSAVNEHVIHALLATEDIRFYDHCGIDVRRIGGALLADIKAGGYVQGASTITQQLIKNSHLTNEKTLLRKGQEALLALQLERRYDKNDILEMYLNFVYFGRGAYGIESAAQAYFGVSAGDVTLSQAAVLVGILKAPGRYSPHLHPEAAEKRRAVVLDQMVKYGFIDENERKVALKEPITVVPSPEIADFGYYTDYVLEQGAELLNISVNDLLGGGYRIYTSLDGALQERVQAILADAAFFPSEDTEGAAVILDNTTGAILALVGGREHEGMRLYNRALAARQPGSCLKPLLVYGPALEENLITCATILDDSRRSFDGYSPKNFRDVYYGSVTVRRALALSLNVPAVDVLNRVGIGNAKKSAEAMGISFDPSDCYLALALGGMAYGTSPLALAGAYRTLAVGGTFQTPWCIDRITDASGRELYRHTAKETRVMKETTAFLLTDILCDVSRQSGNVLSSLPAPIACKTGTVGYVGGGYSDIWCTSYTLQNTVCVWMGSDYTDETHHLPDEATGSTYPAAVTKAIIEPLREGIGMFPVPDGIVRAVTEDGRTEYFTEETVPDPAEEPQKPSQPRKIAVQWDEFRACEINVTCAERAVSYTIYRFDGEKNVCVATVSGETGQMFTIKDPAYRQGDCYWILPVHAGLSGEKSDFYQPE